MNTPAQLTYGFIGFGRMAQSLWRGFQSVKGVESSHVFVCDTNDSIHAIARDTFRLQVMDMASVVTHSDVVFVCVKPQNIAALLDGIQFKHARAKTWVSILAGIPISVFQSKLGKDCAIVRVMPNTPAAVGEGLSALSFSSTVSTSHRMIIRQLFDGCGTTVEVEEAMMDVITGLSGSGPAFLYRIADTMAKVGVAKGLDAATAQRVMAQTLIGAGKMLLNGSQSASQLIEAVSSPNGTTVAGLSVFDKLNLDTQLSEVVETTIRRAQELGTS